MNTRRKLRRRKVGKSFHAVGPTTENQCYFSYGFSVTVTVIVI